MIGLLEGVGGCVNRQAIGKDRQVGEKETRELSGCEEQRGGKVVNSETSPK